MIDRMDLLILIATAFGVIGLPWTFFSWMKPRLGLPRLVWGQLSSSAIISEEASSITSLSIRFGDQELETATLWTGKFWNAGRSPIRGADLRNLRFVSSGGRLLDAWIEAVSTRENGVSVVVDRDSDCCRVQFDFLNHSEGAKLSLLHTGNAGEQVSIQGAVVGCELHEEFSSGHREKRVGVRGAFASLPLFLGMPVFAGVIYALYAGDLRDHPDVQEAIFSTVVSWPIGIMAAVLLAMWGLILYAEIRASIDRRAEPQDLKGVR